MVLFRTPVLSKPMSVLLLLFLIGCSWGGFVMHTVTPDDLVRFTGYDTEPRLIRVHGRLSNVDTTGVDGSRASLDLERIMLPSRSHAAVEGRISCRIGGVVPVHDGCEIEVTGWLHPPGGTSAPEPGDPDWISIARRGGHRGRLDVPEDGLIRIIEPTEIRDHIHLLRGRARRWCMGVLSEDIESDDERMLLSAVSIGVQGVGWNRVASGFRRIGVAHLLAISGMHLGIVLGFVLLVLRRFGVRARMQGVAVLVMTLLYLGVVTWRPPILRAGLMAVLVSAGLCSRRFPTSIGLLAFAALVLSALDPGSLFLPGFQLSFLIVFFMVTGTTTVHRRWFGPGGRSSTSLRARFIGGVKTAFTVSVIAWLASVPIVLHHFGTFSPYSVPASLLLIPIVTLLLGLVFVKLSAAVIGLEWIVPGAVMEMLLGSVLWIVDVIDAAPGSCIMVDEVPLIIVPIGLVLVAAWIRFGLRESCWTLRHAIVRLLRRPAPTAHTAGRREEPLAGPPNEFES